MDKELLIVDETEESNNESPVFKPSVEKNSATKQDSGKLSDIFLKFTQQSSLHGLRYTAPRTPLRWVWVGVLTCALLYTLVRVALDMAMTNKDEFATSTEIFYHKELLPFPAISFCFVNNFNKSIANGMLARLSAEGRLPLGRVRSPPPEYDIPGEQLRSAIEQYSMSFSEKLIDCDWVKQDGYNPWTTPNICGTQNFTQYFNYRGELCYTANSGARGHGVLHAENEGQLHGYGFLFYTLSQIALDSHPYTGVRAVVHNQNTPPHLLDGFLLPTGAHSEVQLHYTEVHNIDCGTKELKYFDTYSQRRCVLEQLTELIGSECSCRDLFMPDNGMEYCSLQEMYSCVFKQKERFFTMDISLESCPRDCVEVRYSYETSDARYLHNIFVALMGHYELYQKYEKRRKSNHTVSRKTFMEGLKWLKEMGFTNQMGSTNKIEHNIASVTFYYKEMIEEITTQKFVGGDVLGTIGGEMALIIGASALTIIELVDFVVLWLCSKRRACSASN